MEDYMLKRAIVVALVAVGLCSTILPVVAASPIDSFPEFAGCSKGVGTWYKAIGDMNNPGNLVKFEVRADGFYYASDYLGVKAGRRGAEAFSAFRLVPLSRNGSNITVQTGNTLSDSSWVIYKTATGFEGKSKVKGYTDSNLKLDCSN